MAKQWAKWFYNSGAWRAARHECLVHGGFTCRMCGARATEVHHEPELTPVTVHDPVLSLGQEHLVPLCGDCHKAITPKHGEEVTGDCELGFTFNADGVLTPPGVADSTPPPETDVCPYPEPPPRCMTPHPKTRR